eukprot:4678069-Prymnesium_polylepis.1
MPLWRAPCFDPCLLTLHARPSSPPPPRCRRRPPCRRCVSGRRATARSGRRPSRSRPARTLSSSCAGPHATSGSTCTSRSSWSSPSSSSSSARGAPSTRPSWCRTTCRRRSASFRRASSATPTACCPAPSCRTCGTGRSSGGWCSCSRSGARSSRRAACGARSPSTAARTSSSSSCRRAHTSPRCPRAPCASPSTRSTRSAPSSRSPRHRRARRRSCVTTCPSRAVRRTSGCAAAQRHKRARAHRPTVPPTHRPTHRALLAARPLCAPGGAARVRLSRPAPLAFKLGLPSARPADDRARRDRAAQRHARRAHEPLRRPAALAPLAAVLPPAREPRWAASWRKDGGVSQRAPGGAPLCQPA